jgi:mutator protein MutT
MYADMPQAKLTPYVHVAIGIVVGADGRVLVSRRKAGGSFAGYWEFPGGKCEAGEAPENCVRRELREELDILVTPTTPLPPIKHLYPKTRVVLFPFICRHDSGNPVALSAVEFRWVSPPELTALQFPEANADLIADLARGRWISRQGPSDPQTGPEGARAIDLRAAGA